MKQSETPQKRKKNGIPTWKIVLPITLVLIVLHTLVIGAIISINKASNGLTELMATYSGYISDVTDLQAGASFLSETAAAFTLHPKQEESGETNIAPLVAYTNELLENPRRGDDIKNRFAGRDLIGEEILEEIEIAAENAKKMVEVQLHAVALTLAVYPAPDIPGIPVANLPLLALSQEEQAMSNEQKLGKAFDLITGSEYSGYKKLVSDNVTLANGALRKQLQTRSIAQLKKVAITRVMLWVTTISVICVLFFTFFLLISLLVHPLGGFVRGINAGTSIPDEEGLSEVRLVARSYNELLERKNALENVLRSAAETDALTDLPNRYHMEQYLLQKDKEGTSIAFFLFDVNFLKITNDKEGHIAGDALLKRAAACLSETFADFPEAKCFRYGGDEFIAILKNCGEEDIQTVFARFEAEQKKCNVSIAVGCAYAPDVQKTTIKTLFDEADKKMYEDKKRIHERQGSD